MKLFCVGKNYAAHASEMQSAVPQSPVIFMKPATAVLLNGRPFYYPDFSSDIHYEVEVVLKVGKQGKNVHAKNAWDHISHVTLGIDFTARDIQSECKKNGYPWELAKSFDFSAAIGDMQELSAFPSRQFEFFLEKNNKKVQHGRTKDMVFDVPTLISFISERFTLQKGDLLFTGTPEGVGPVKSGDVLEGFLKEKKVLYTEIK